MMKAGFYMQKAILYTLPNQTLYMFGLLVTGILNDGQDYLNDGCADKNPYLHDGS